METKLEEMKTKFEEMKTKFEEMETKFGEMETKLDDKPSVNDPCVVCGWSQETVGTLKFDRAVKIKKMNWPDRDWHLGSRHVIRDHHEEGSTLPLLATLAFLQEVTTIPVPKIVASWEEPNGRFIVIEERKPGVALSEIWPSLSETERDDIAQQTANHLKQLRSLKSDRIQNIDGTPIYSDRLFRGFKTKPSGLIETKEELWDAMAVHLRKWGYPEKDLDALGKSMPSPEPYTFTLGDLHIGQITVKDKKVVGINEWEESGYLPCWYEYAMASIYECGESDLEIMNNEWKTVLRPKLEKHEDGAAWFYGFRIELYKNTEVYGY